MYKTVGYKKKTILLKRPQRFWENNLRDRNSSSKHIVLESECYGLP